MFLTFKVRPRSAHSLDISRILKVRKHTAGEHAVAGDLTSFHDHSGIKFLPMPRLSPSMEKGKILKWHIKPGDLVKSYQLILDVSTPSLRSTGQTKDFNMEIELLEDMFCADIFLKEGQEVIVGKPIASFCDDFRDIEILKNNPVRN
jgi:hypothetical protein